MGQRGWGAGAGSLGSRRRLPGEILKSGRVARTHQGVPSQFSIRPDAAAGWPWVTLEGHLTLEVILETIDALCVDGAYATPSRLWDVRGCTVDLSNEDLREIVEYGSARDRGAGRVAILAGSDLSYGLGRMYEVFRSSRNAEYRAFREEDRALEWLTTGRDRSTPAGPGNP